MERKLGSHGLPARGRDRGLNRGGGLRRCLLGMVGAVALFGAGAAYALGDQPSARYRVTIRGFAVDHQSQDDMLQRDGANDEVYVRSDIFMVDSDGGHSAGPRLITRRIGDLVTGRTYPPGAPHRERGGGPRPDDLPLVVWEDDLSQAADAIVIVPSIWEWDGEGPSTEERQWNGALGFQLTGPGAAAPFRELIRAWPGSRSAPVVRDLVSLPIGDDGTRPIGSSRTGGAPMRIPVVVLTYESALAAAARRVPLPEFVEGNPDISQDGSYPRGVVPVALADGDGLEGRYTLFLYVECLDRCG